MTQNRRDFLASSAVGAFVLGFWLPPRAARAGENVAPPHGAAWYEDPTAPEINAWIAIAPDDTVTIRIAQTELGQGVWTSNAMIGRYVKAASEQLAGEEFNRLGLGVVDL